jgi:hypothetical protein
MESLTAGKMSHKDKEEKEDEFQEKIKDKPDLPKDAGKAKKDDANEDVG